MAGVGVRGATYEVVKMVKMITVLRSEDTLLRAPGDPSSTYMRTERSYQKKKKV